MNKERSRSEERERKAKINSLLRFLVFCRSSPARKGRREDVVSDPPACLDFLAVVREPTRRQWRWRVEETCHHVFATSKGCPTLFFFEFFGVYFVNF
jgi:hypothetical protein